MQTQSPPQASLQTLDFSLGGPNEGMTEGWFLGPHAENADVLKELIAFAIDKHCEYRREFHPEDPSVVTDAIKALPIYRKQIQTLREETAKLCEGLQFSAPIFSLRHQGHMLWDQAMPAIVGYIAAMLYNQNNVAVEASPVTTQLEIAVGNDLCAMLGYDTSGKTIRPWGHITCDGSVANIESLWTARNIKLWPLALQAALRNEPAMAAAKDMQVTLLDGSSAKIAGLDAWTLLNLKIDDIVSLPLSIEQQFGISVDVTTSSLQDYAVQNIGLVEYYRRFMTGVTNTPIAFAPSTHHYSWPKAATLIGIGQNNLVSVHVDRRARMDLAHLQEQLDRAVQDRIPVLSVVAVIGSTEESAVDPLADILQLRETYRKRGVEFSVHADAAWGGYFASMLRPDVVSGKIHVLAYVPSVPMSPYVEKQYKALRGADSITVDPHKAGYVPYPAGGLCYRNSAMRDFVSLKAPVVFHNQSDPTVGVYGIEGSKPGAAAAAVYLSHRMIRPTQGGYGKILSQCIWTSKRMYCRLATMTDPRFTLTLVQQLPAELENKSPSEIEKQRQHIRDRFLAMSNKELETYLRMPANADDAALFAELGSDQVILTYAFNFIDKNGTPNRDITNMNKLNGKVFDLCSMSTPPKNWGDLNKTKLILTSSSFDPAGYGQDFVDGFARRTGCTPSPNTAINTLISTTMNPWTTDTPVTPEAPDGDFLIVIDNVLRDSVHQALDELGFA